MAALTSSLGSFAAAAGTAFGWLLNRSAMRHRRQTICRLAAVQNDVRMMFEFVSFTIRQSQCVQGSEQREQATRYYGTRMVFMNRTTESMNTS